VSEHGLQYGETDFIKLVSSVHGQPKRRFSGKLLCPGRGGDVDGTVSGSYRMPDFGISGC
jgi:hypothetical protein